MNKLATLAKMHSRRMFAVAGVHLIKSKYSRWQAELYQESVRPERPTYVNLGAGAFYHPLWHNVDVPNDYYSTQQDNLHIAHDFSKATPLPFENDSVSVFYCSHLIEHLSNASVNHLFKEAHRCLRPGGVFRITCPDMALQYRAYQRRDSALWGNTSPWKTQPQDLEQRFLEHFATALAETHNHAGVSNLSSQEFVKLFESNNMAGFFDTITARLPENINSLMPEGHCNWFSQDKINSMLSIAGFATIMNSHYLQSIEPKLRDPRLFDGTCPDISLYIECVK